MKFNLQKSIYRLFQFSLKREKNLMEAAKFADNWCKDMSSELPHAKTLVQILQTV